MENFTEFADKLRIGEGDRDASSKVAGFLYQDLIALDIILNCSDDDKVYMEWVEDIYVEKSNKIDIYQVKHYPKTYVNFPSIYKELFYQFLKLKLYMNKYNFKKDINTFCVNYSKTQYYKKKCREGIKLNNGDDINKINIEEILMEFDKKKDDKKEIKINFIIQKVANSKLLDEFNFVDQKRESIETISNSLKNKLCILLEDKLTDIKIKENDIDDVLLSTAVYNIQKSYAREGTEEHTADKRFLNKKILISKLESICILNDEKYVERLKIRLLGYVDEVYKDISSEISNETTIEEYALIYKSTKEYFYKILETKQRRFKFLNTISIEPYEVLNWQNYNRFNIEQEKDLFLEHKLNISIFIKTIWKILFSINCKSFEEYIIELDEAFIFNFPSERVDSVLVVASDGNQPKRNAGKVLTRVIAMKNKPKKWYLSRLKGTYEYSFNVNNISSAKINEKFSVAYTNDNAFGVECMNCVRIDEGEMGEKEIAIDKELFALECKGEE